MTSEIEQLREENARLRAQLESLRGRRGDRLDSRLDAVATFVFCADAGFRVTYAIQSPPGVALEGLQGTNLVDCHHPDSRPRARAALARALAGDAAHYRARVTIQGEDRYVSASAVPIRASGGETGLVVIAFDVTAGDPRERSLRDSQRKLELAVEATGLGLWSFDVKAGVVVWDEQMHAITGYPTPLTTEGWLDTLVHPDDRATIAASMERSHRGDFRVVPHRIVRPDGEIRWVVSHGMVVVDEAGEVTHMYGGLLDITEQQRLEEQNRRAQKLEAVGSLTAGVAHNFNNLLMAILPTLDLLGEVVPATHADLLKDATHAAQRGAELVRELMTFAGQERRASHVVESPQAFVEHAVTICRRTFERAANVQVRIEPELPSVLCDPGALEHALVNVLLNARDALKNGEGTIEVVARRATEQDERRADLGGGEWLCVEVRDDGVGVPPEVRDRIFEPFFTTKGPQGTGLGLSTVYAVVREHGGRIDFESGVRGTTFRLYLPCCDASLSASTPIRDTKGLVLLIDDEPAVRRVVRTMLEVSGYRVLEADGGEQALGLAGANAPDVVLLDRSMPGQSGPALLPELRARLPRAKVLYFTGQHIPANERRQVDGVIQKPTRIGPLVEAIERVLA